MKTPDLPLPALAGARPRQAAAHGPQHGSKLAAVLAIIISSYLMLVVDISIVLTGLPKIQAELAFSAAGLSWVQNAYTLAFGGLLLLGARAGDLFGRRRMFIAGLAVFTGASLVIGVAQTPGWMLFARAVQGTGAAILAPSTLALLSTHFAEGPGRTRAFAYYSAAAGVGASLGLVLGGLMADLFSWRLGFFINLPIGLALVWGARRHLAETPRRAGGLDVPGALTSTLGMTAVVFGIVRAAEVGWSDAIAAASVATGVVLLVGFVMHESRAAHPILPLHLFASRERSGAYGARLLFLGGMVGFWFFSTQYLQGVLGYTPLRAGLAFLPVTLPNLAAALLVPRLARACGSTRVLAAGLAVSAVGMAWLAQVTAHSAYVTAVALPMVLIGLGQGAALGPLTVAAVAGVGHDDAGAASGLVNVAHQIGGALGLSALVAVSAATTTATSVAAEHLAHRIANTFGASTVLLVLALAVVALTLFKRRSP
ncbi:MAG: major facilitator superfamily 1 [Rhodoferax sp.]|nr:major facilitator superfamily 1 [Rhodoferax sp.]